MPKKTPLLHLPPHYVTAYTGVIFSERYQPIHKLAFNVCNVMFFRQIQHFAFVLLFTFSFFILVLTFSRYFTRLQIQSCCLRCCFCCLFYSFPFVPFDSVLRCDAFFFFVSIVLHLLCSATPPHSPTIPLRFYCYF